MNKKTILIAGGAGMFGGASAQLISKMESEGHKVVLADNNKSEFEDLLKNMPKEFTSPPANVLVLNNVEYVEKPMAKGNARISGYVAAMMAMYGCLPNIGSKQKSLPTHDIIGEFERIQRKESKLSRSERDAVVQEFYKHFQLK